MNFSATLVAALPTFPQVLAQHALQLTRTVARVLQLNIGRKCNQTCAHCHVNAGPFRTEAMSRETMQNILNWLQATDIEIVDITGGAPELNPDFRWLVAQCRALNRHVMDRCNLTICEETGHQDLPQFFARNQVEIVASLPCYTAENVNAQRGDAVFEKSIRVLQKLNALGYGTNENLGLHLVYNPLGAFLPPSQAALEADYKTRLSEDFGIVFNQLFALANLPIARFATQLRRENQWQEYHELLIKNFNPATVNGLMCRDTINVDWQGRVYDCDFNQMLRINQHRAPLLWEIDANALENAPIATGLHCFGCTAGAGSSCGGAVT